MKTKKISILIISAILLSLFSFTAMAASEPGLLIDFSDEPILNGVSAQMDYNFINDGDKRVMEVIALADGADTYNTFDMDDVVVGDDNFIDADTYHWVKMSIKNESVCPKFELHFGGSVFGLSAKCCTQIDISTQDTEYQTYIFDMKQANKDTFYVHPNEDFSEGEETSYWTGMIETFRVDWGYIEEPGGMAPEGKIMNVQYIAIFDSKEAAEAYEFVPLNGPKEETTAPPTEEETVAAETTTTAEDTTVAENNDAANDVTDEANDTTEPTTTSSTTDDSSSPVIWIIIASVAVVAIIAVVVVVSKKKG